MRQNTGLDNFIIGLENRLKKRSFTSKSTHSSLSTLDSGKKLSASLMRVNHSGEVCAQALYLGQASVARDPILKDSLNTAAREEKLHLEMCRDRLIELQDKPSLLNPVFAIGSFTIGAAFGLAGDKVSLGFLAETEQQVVKHLDQHLARLPADDQKSKEILLKMREDELKHAHHASDQGGIPLPAFVRKMMAGLSKIMTLTTFYI